MNLKWNYGQGVLVLPSSVLSADASPEQIRVLLWLASDPTLSEKPAQLAKLADTDSATVRSSLDFWKSCGVLTTEAAETIETPKKAAVPAKNIVTPEKKLHRGMEEPPSYKTNELSDLLEKHASLRMLIDASQNVFGKMFTTLETNIVIGLVDYYGLDEEYILILLAYWKQLGKHNISSALNKQVCSLIDRDVCTAEKLEAYLQAQEAALQLTGAVRHMFGLKDRELITKEKKAIEKWAEYGYDKEIVRRAYEITINSTGNASIPYANSILERWHSEGLKTAEEIDRRLEQERQEKEGKTTLGSSFQIDDFFEAALQKSFRNGQNS